MLAPAVWVDALRIPEGPPVELLDALRRHGVPILRSAALLDAIDAALTQLGWDQDARARGRTRVTEVTTERDATRAAQDAVAIAKSAGLDTVYTVGPETGQSRDGVSLRPVHELITRMQRIPLN